MTAPSPHKASLDRNVSPGLYSATLTRQDCEEFFVTATLRPGETRGQLLERVARFLEEHSARVIALDLIAFSVTDDELKQSLGSVDYPISHVLDQFESTHGLGGLYVQAVSDLTLETIKQQDRVIGVHWSDSFADYCRLGGFHLKQPTPVEEAYAELGLMKSILEDLGLRFKDVARTWFFFDAILAWYGDFNIARKTFFDNIGLPTGMIPASTGIGGGNPYGTALESGLLAMRARAGQQASFHPLPSPLQCPANDYGSFFSRAVEINLPDHRRVLVSGTASIDIDGNCVLPDDMEAQIDLTMKVVGAILESRGMTYKDVTRSYAYYKDGADIPRLVDLVRSHSCHDMPLVAMQNDVCFKELLFEIEVDAVRCDDPPAT